MYGQIPVYEYGERVFFYDDHGQHLKYNYHTWLALGQNIGDNISEVLSLQYQKVFSKDRRFFYNITIFLEKDSR